MRFSEWTIPGLPQLDCTAIHGNDYDPANYGVSVHWHGRSILYLGIVRRRVETACFAHDLSPDELRGAVSVMRDAGNGLDHWIVPALEYSQATLTQLEDKPEALKLIPELLESVRALPVAAPWKRQRRETQKAWERWRQENPEAEANPPPWVSLREPATTKARPSKPRGTPAKPRPLERTSTRRPEKRGRRA